MPFLQVFSAVSSAQQSAFSPATNIGFQGQLTPFNPIDAVPTSTNFQSSFFGAPTIQGTNFPQTTSFRQQQNFGIGSTAFLGTPQFQTTPQIQNQVFTPSNTIQGQANSFSDLSLGASLGLGINTPLLSTPQLNDPSQANCYSRTCDQLIVGRTLPYSRALEIIQDELYLEAADFNIIRRRKKRKVQDFFQDYYVDQMELKHDIVKRQTQSNVTMTSITPSMNQIMQDPRPILAVGLLFGALATAFLQPDTVAPPAEPPQGQAQPPQPPQPPVPTGPPIFNVQPPLGQAPAGQPQPGEPGGGAPPLPTNPTAQEALTNVPADGVAVAVFPPVTRPRTRDAVCVIYSESDEASIRAAGFDPPQTRKQRRFKRGVMNRLYRRFIASPLSRLRRRLFVRRGRSRASSSLYSDGSGNGNVVEVERLFGIACRVKFTERCTLGVTCDLNGNRINNRRQGTGQDFQSDAPSECRTEFTGCN